MSRVARRVLGLTTMVLLLSCSKANDTTPEGAVRELMLMTRAGNAVRAYALLAPQSQRRLQEMARLATAQTGGQKSIAPHDLLAVSLDPVRYRLGRIEVVDQSADRARLRLHGHESAAQEELNLLRVGGHWRIVLPDRAFGGLAPASLLNFRTCSTLSAPSQKSSASADPSRQPSRPLQGDQSILIRR